ncbi:hypothetical protein [Halocalculus aciditolerans]|uniref:AbrB/MazE/SpoVT family DNA-binding domain-containing protein n=1 Tax=Halocalculus aciditolerans TaxID=1383812 RepID=A0A830FNQ1_9EURY|nr:hypothetical protein [Halocalculus aciditolerans]GGL73464.1 hypothetical protein GCM10009039_34470 [Halocalculus aciditolerans]
MPEETHSGNTTAQGHHQNDSVSATIPQDVAKAHGIEDGDLIHFETADSDETVRFWNLSENRDDE